MDFLQSISAYWAPILAIGAIVSAVTIWIRNMYNINLLRKQIRQSQLQIADLEHRLHERDSIIIKPTWEQIKQIIPRDLPKGMVSYISEALPSNRKGLLETDEKDASTEKRVTRGSEKQIAKFSEVINSPEFADWLEKNLKWLDFTFLLAERQFDDVESFDYNDFIRLKEIKQTRFYLTKHFKESPNNYHRMVNMLGTLQTIERVLGEISGDAFEMAIEAAKELNSVLLALLAATPPGWER